MSAGGCVVAHRFFCVWRVAMCLLTPFGVTRWRPGWRASSGVAQHIGTFVVVVCRAEHAPRSIGSTGTTMRGYAMLRCARRQVAISKVPLEAAHPRSVAAHSCVHAPFFICMLVSGQLGEQQQLQ